MCFSAEVSLLTYILGMSGSLALYTRGDQILALFYATVVQMQLVDLVIWKYPACGTVNTSATRAGILINHLEPLVLYAGIVALSTRTLPLGVHALVFWYTLYSLYYTTKALRGVTCTTVTEESKPHLHWKWNDMSGKQTHYTLFLLVLVALSVYGLDSGLSHALILLISFFMSFSVYQKRKSTGAMWCFLAAFVPWLLVLFPFKQ